MVYQNIFLLLGSNLGDRLSNLSKCSKLIEAHVGSVINRSSVYETAAWGKTDQTNFLNQALQIESTLSPHEMLTACLAIEKNLGRIRDEKWAERTIDVDIIYYGSKVIDTEDLRIPHPRMADRKFVLIPLVEISAHFVHPALKKTNEQLLGECTDTLPVNAYTGRTR